jgi:hypothetical protein
MIDLAAHERPPETMRSPKVVARDHAVIDPFYRYRFSRCHAYLPIGATSLLRLLILYLCFFVYNLKSKIENPKFI